MPKTTPCMNPQKGARLVLYQQCQCQCSSATALPRQSCISSIAPAEHGALTGSITLIAAASLALTFDCQRAQQWHVGSKISPLQGNA